MPPWDDEEEFLDDEDLLADEEEEEEWVGLGEEGRPGFRAALFSSQAACYAKFRPHYPQQVRGGGGWLTTTDLRLCPGVSMRLRLHAAHAAAAVSADALHLPPLAARALPAAANSCGASQQAAPSAPSTTATAGV